MKPLQVNFPLSLRRRFSRRAKAAFPVETLAVMIGQRKGCQIDVLDLLFPEPASADENTVSVNHTWYDILNCGYQREGLQVIGDLHSHCYAHPIIDAAPSETDWEQVNGLPSSCTLHAVCAITQKENGKRRARFRFWPRIPLPKVSK